MLDDWGSMLMLLEKPEMALDANLSEQGDSILSECSCVGVIRAAECWVTVNDSSVASK
jgi:hypothetical protein